MNRLKKKVTLLNTISTLLLQLTSMLVGLLIPKLILDSFGSETNGLISSLSQFLSYITLVEGGVTGVITASLYGPLAKKDNQKLTRVIVTAKKFHQRIGLVFIIYAIFLAVLYPIIFNTGFSFGFVASLTLILSIQLSIQYMLSVTYRTLLNADKKIYIVSLIQILLQVLEIIFAIIVIKIYPNIHLLKLSTGAVFILQPILYSHFVKKYYSINLSENADPKILKNRWNGFAINTAAFIHNSTDVAVLTVFTNLITVSIYSVYALVTEGIKKIINALTTSLNPTLGLAYARKDYKDLNQKLSLYEFIVFILVFFIFGVATLLITPFVGLYTANLSDANYFQPVFGTILIIAEALYLLKFPHLNLAYSANKFKEISKPAFIEAGLNIIVSIALVPFLGLIGVAIGTLVAMLYRLVFHVYYTTKIIPGRHQWIFYRKLLIFTTSTITSIGLCLLIPSPESTIVSWLWHAASYSAIIGTSLAVVSLLFFRPELKFLKHYLRKK